MKMFYQKNDDNIRDEDKKNIKFDDIDVNWSETRLN